MYTILLCFQAFNSYNVKLQVQRINDLPAIFPAITICNQNPYYERSKKVMKILSSKLNGVHCFINSSSGDQFQKCFKLANPGIDSLSDSFDFFIDRLNRILAGDTNLTSDQLSQMGYDLYDDMLVSCQYNNGNCMGLLNDLNSSKYRDNHRGNCYTFNIKKRLLQTSATGEYIFTCKFNFKRFNFNEGESSGLHLELTVSKYSFFMFLTPLKPLY